MGLNIDKIEKKLCTGCKACGDICPKAAISYQISDEGFWYPIINESKCVSCGKCYDVCPINKEEQLEEFTKQAYASWNRDKIIRRESTSGGVYCAFAEYVLEKGGYIIGSTYTDDFCGAYHICSNTYDGLKKIIGSKYFQSDTEGIYRETKKILREGKLVLFTGTPCQVKALKNFLGIRYENLITIDFICRGVPSPMIQKKKIELYEKKKKSKVVFYRDKWDKYAWIHFGELIKYENGKEQFISRWRDDVLACFIRENLNVRESCYSCGIKDGKNSSEITIGDFWGVSGVTEHDLTSGVSALIVNNQQGKNFLEQVKPFIYLERRPLDEIKKGNPAYVKAIDLPSNRKEFFKSVGEEGLDVAVKRFAKRSLKEKIQNQKRIIRMKNRRFLPLLADKKNIDWFKFLKYNYFCKEIEREKNAYLIPCKGSIIQLDKGARLILEGNFYLNYYPSYKRGSQTSLLRIGNKGELLVHNSVKIAYANTISVEPNASMEMGHFTTNANSNVICKYKMKIGNNVMLARDVCIFDSDYHNIYNDAGEKINHDREVIIEDNVWIGARSMVLKGSRLKQGTIVSANSMVMGDTEENRIFINKREQKSVGDNIIWKR